MNNDKEKRLDEILDAALAEYGNAEPLHGLEDRVLARLQAEPARRPWWVWGAVAAGAAAVAIAAALMMRPAEPKPAPVTATQQPPSVVTPKQETPAIAAQQAQHHEAAPTQRHAPPVTTARVRPQPPAGGQPPIVLQVMQTKLPRRDVFPTPTAPSMDEILLARHVHLTPSDVVLAEAEREPLKFHYDDVPVPATHAGPEKQDSTK